MISGLFILAIRLYQKFWSDGRNLCRLPPPDNCSNRCIRLIQEHGAIAGLRFALGALGVGLADGDVDSECCPSKGSCDSNPGGCNGCGS